MISVEYWQVATTVRVKETESAIIEAPFTVPIIVIV